MCAECGCGNVGRFGVHPLQAPPARPVRLVDEGTDPRAKDTRAPHQAQPANPEDPPASLEHEHEHEHEHVHADGTRHTHAHVHHHPHVQDLHDHDHDHANEPMPAVEPTHRPPTGTTATHRTGEHTLIPIQQPILVRNARLAERNRGYLLAKGVRALNLLSSPGAGKTTLIERTVAALGADSPVAVIVGDLATAHDGERIRRAGAPVVQITTGTVCHLDAEMVARGLEHIELDHHHFLLLENVGNLVCPADFDLGEDARVVLLSVTEGEDKPLKYPPIFRSAQAVVVTKLDLATAAGTDLELLRRNLRATAPGARVFELSARTGDGFEAWIAWLRSLRAA